MPPATKKNKLYHIIIDSSEYYATGTDAHDAYSDIVLHDDAEGNYATQDELSRAVSVTPVDLENLPSFMAWKL